MQPRSIDPLKTRAGDRVRWSFPVGSGTLTVEGVLDTPIRKDEGGTYLAQLTEMKSHEVFVFPPNAEIELIDRPIPPYTVRLMKSPDAPFIVQDATDDGMGRRASRLRAHSTSVRLPSKVISADRIIAANVDSYRHGNDGPVENRLTLVLRVDQIETD